MDNNYIAETTIIDERRKDVVAELMRNVYLWMTGGLALTGLVAWIVATSPVLQGIIFGSRAVLWGLIIAEFVFVIVLSAAINKLSFTTASLLYTLYCVLNGATLSTIFLVYELSSIAEIFFITAGSFAALAFIGTVTNKLACKFSLSDVYLFLHGIK